MSRAAEDMPQTTDVEVWMDDATLGGTARVGTLTRRPSRGGDTIDFQYAPAWLDRAAEVKPFQLDPQLPLHPGLHRARTGAGELTGAFADCSPDRWGRKLMDRREVMAAREHQRKARVLRAWDYLIGVNDESRMGALRLGLDDGRFLDAHGLSAPPMTELRELEAIAHRVELGEEAKNDQELKWIKQLIAPGASLGGARPKASARDVDGTLWLAKFPSAEDRHDVGNLEWLTHQLSRAAGIRMPDAKPMHLSRLGTTFAVQRFDRPASGGRRAYASAFTVLDVDDSENSSYLDIAHAIENVGVPAAIKDDLHQLFRRVAFNVLIGNRDDHLRNHGFLREPNGWRLSPAFDVNPNPDKDVHVLCINADDPSPDTRLLIGTHDYYRLSRHAAQEILDEVRAVVRGWKTVATRIGTGVQDNAVMDAVVDADR
ncbi:type II toxin-antitoxin system HipA family toxin [Stenotrophomonas rhizophila]|uniref:type II toxin-antitoxin system HipA family toxin n=1 Tax=Stenotrophomonas rhizophila TaxID=216778 RepID=UPI0010C03699|nr:type II toxin-antitoxin system HipA family toxin [Stenotrophomonas rhizophila]TKK07566.1 type II toxin-antitoxin system HipA family toxin [Stenotrophomonas rhizophila]